MYVTRHGFLMGDLNARRGTLCVLYVVEVLTLVLYLEKNVNQLHPPDPFSFKNNRTQQDTKSYTCYE